MPHSLWRSVTLGCMPLKSICQSDVWQSATLRCVKKHETANRVPENRHYVHQTAGDLLCKVEQLQNRPTGWTNGECRRLSSTAASVTRFVTVSESLFFLQVLLSFPFFFCFSFLCFECFRIDIISDHK